MVIIGSPEPYDAFVREGANGERIIVFDVARFLQYDNFIESAVRNIITHEVSHVKNFNIHNLYTEDVRGLEELKQQLFDEGFDHYVSGAHSYFNNSEAKNRELKEHVYDKLRSSLDQEITNEVLEQGNSGSFWSKFISISGYFLIFDYLDAGGSAKDLFERGYEHFRNYWETKNTK